jgi:hypothetical protein
MHQVAELGLVQIARREARALVKTQKLCAQIRLNYLQSRQVADIFAQTQRSRPL